MKKSFSILSVVLLLVFLTSMVFAQNPIEIKDKAFKGNAHAQDKLGCMYAEGIGVKKDLSAARLWWHKAASQGNANAQYNLGLMYAKGDGVGRDYRQAKLLWQKAAAQGHPKAKAKIRQMPSN